MPSESLDVDECESALEALGQIGHCKYVFCFEAVFADVSSLGMPLMKVLVGLLFRSLLCCYLLVVMPV